MFLRTQKHSKTCWCNIKKTNISSHIVFASAGIFSNVPRLAGLQTAELVAIVASLTLLLVFFPGLAPVFLTPRVKKGGGDHLPVIGGTRSCFLLFPFCVFYVPLAWFLFSCQSPHSVCLPFSVHLHSRTSYRMGVACLAFLSGLGGLTPGILAFTTSLRHGPGQWPAASSRCSCRCCRKGAAGALRGRL